ITVVVAAGNFGKTASGKSVYGGITTPANSPYALAVGAIDTHGTAQRSDDTLAGYSSKGPTRYDLIIKADLAAPGSHIASAEAADSYLAKTYPERHVSGTGANAVIELSGTSMSAGVVSGAVALLIDDRDHLKPLEARAILELTSSFMPEVGLIGAGAGEINVLSAATKLDSGWSLKTAASFALSSALKNLVGGSTQARLLILQAKLNGNGSIGPTQIIWSDQII